MFRTITLTCSKRDEWIHVKVMHSGRKNCSGQCNYCNKQFLKLFTFFATVLINYCVVVATYSILVYVR